MTARARPFPEPARRTGTKGIRAKGVRAKGVRAKGVRAKPKPEATGAVEPPGWQTTFIEQVGLHADIGMPRSLARVIAWLVVCEPRYQSAAEIGTTLKLSTGSVSAAVTTLVRSGIVARVTFPGQRRIYYELRPDGWQRLLRLRLQMLVEVRHVADQAIAAGGAGADERLRSMRDFYADCEAQFTKLLNRYTADLARTAPSSRPGGKKGAR